MRRTRWWCRRISLEPGGRSRGAGGRRPQRAAPIAASVLTRLAGGGARRLRSGGLAVLAFLLRSDWSHLRQLCAPDRQQRLLQDLPDHLPVERDRHAGDHPAGISLGLSAVAAL